MFPIEYSHLLCYFRDELSHANRIIVLAKLALIGGTIVRVSVTWKPDIASEPARRIFPGGSLDLRMGRISQ
jgi:hypothetical protein